MWGETADNRAEPMANSMESTVGTECAGCAGCSGGGLYTGISSSCEDCAPAAAIGELPAIVAGCLSLLDTMESDAAELSHWMTHRQILWAKEKLVEYQKFAAMERGEQIDFLLCDGSEVLGGDAGGARLPALHAELREDPPGYRS